MFRCPICKTPVEDAPAGQRGGTFPFCSERCKLIDLGRWLDGKYQIPATDDEETKGPVETDAPRRFPTDDDDP